MKETELTTQIRALLREHRIWHYKHAASPYGRNGISDIIGILPGGRYLAIEVKTPAGKLSEKQHHFLTDVNEAGGLGIVARSTMDVITALGLPDLFA